MSTASIPDASRPPASASREDPPPPPPTWAARDFTVARRVERSISGDGQGDFVVALADHDDDAAPSTLEVLRQGAQLLPSVPVDARHDDVAGTRGVELVGELSESCTWRKEAISFSTSR